MAGGWRMDTAIALALAGVRHAMMGYALRRLLGAMPTLFIIVTLTFFMMRAAPGGPFDSQRRLPPEVEHNIKAAYDLDKPLYQQYLHLSGQGWRMAIWARPSRTRISPWRS